MAKLFLQKTSKVILDFVHEMEKLGFLAFGKSVFKFAIQITVISSYKVFLSHLYDILNSISLRKLLEFLYNNT